MYKLASASDQLRVYSYNQKTVESTLIQSVDAQLNSISWSPDNTTLLAISGQQVLFIDERHDQNSLETNPIIESYPLSYIQKSLFGFKSGRYCYFATLDNNVQVFDRKEKKYIDTVSIPGTITCFAITSDDHRFACGLDNGKVVVHSLKHKITSILESPFEAAVTCLGFYPFKKSVLVAGSKRGEMKMWDINTSLKAILEKVPHQAPITGISFAPCNKHFYCTISLDKKVLFHDINAGKGLLQCYKTEHGLLSISINDEHLVVMGNTNGEMLFYDLRLKSIVHKIQCQGPVTHVAFQAPKWAVTASIKDAIFVSSAPQADPIPVKPGAEPKSISAGHLDMFSPIARKVQKPTHDLRRQVTTKVFFYFMKLQQRLKSVNGSISAESVVGEKGLALQGKKSKSAEDLLSKESITTDVMKKLGGLVGEAVSLVPNDQGVDETIQSLQPTGIQQIIQDINDKSKIDTITSHVNDIIVNDEDILKKPKESTRKKEYPTLKSIPQNNDPQILQIKTDPTTFQYKLLKSVVDEAVQEHYERVHEEIQNMHIEMIRQFQIQKMELQSIIQNRVPFQDIMDLVKELRLENQRLRK